VIPADLSGPLLRAVSRSFFLTIRLLPARLRAPVSLAYLLARASDTIADSTDAPAVDRRRWLGAFLRMIREGGRDRLSEIQAGARSHHAGENELMARLDRCLVWLESLGEFDRTAIREVMAKIVHGQTLDVQRFGAGGVTALDTAAELEEYTYLVAGCVGEFWTRLCLHHIPRYSTLPPDRLQCYAAEFGKALQLVNILRDLPADLRSGRCYLPASEIDAARLAADPVAGRECFLRWLRQARDWLESGREYICSLRPARVRAGCFLPWELARRTLALLEATPALEASERIKVSRQEVRRSLCVAALAAFSNRPLRGR
jgi:farnesyl-diphosphate farnesyltransferase